MRRGFIGLGNIGGLIVRDLIDAPGSCLIHDLSADAVEQHVAMGARAARSPAELAEGADHIGICVRTDQDVHDVMEGPEGVLKSARPGTLVTIHSTVRIATLRAVTKRAAAADVRIVDAPVTRGVTSPARKGIVFILGGEAPDRADASAFVEPAALRIVEAGPPGTGMACKLANNLLTYLTFVAITDAVTIAESAGLDPALLADVTVANGIASPMMRSLLMARAGKAIPDNINRPPVEMLIGLAEKDLACLIEEARETLIDLPAADLALAQIGTAFRTLVGSGASAARDPSCKG